MDVGTAVRRARANAGLGRGALAKRAHIPEDTLKKIEAGKTGVSLSMLERIACALGVAARQLLPDADPGPPSSSAPTPSPPYPAPATPPEPLPPPRPTAERRAPDAPSARAPSAEHWILLGDEAADRADALAALRAYERAEALMPRRDYTWARLVLERVGQALINLNAFEHLERQIQRVDAEYQRPFVARYGQEDGRVRMLVEEKAAWMTTWRGEVPEAITHGMAAHRLATTFGDEPTVSATGLHMAGRALAEAPTTLILYHRLFPRLAWDAAARSRLERAEANLRAVQGMERRELSRGFNAQWLARSLRAQGNIYEARKFTRYWRELFGANSSAAEAKLDAAKLLLIDDGGDPREGVHDARDILDAIRETFKLWRYVPGLAEAATTDAYLCFVGRQPLTPKERAESADLCLVSLRLHPYPRHPNTLVARRLLSVFVQAMARTEYLAYSEEVTARVASGAAPFDVLRYLFAPETVDIGAILADLRAARAPDAGGRP